MLKAVAALVQRDFAGAVRRWGELANPVIFFVAVTVLFPLSLSPDPVLLARIAPGVIWVAALFSVLLGQDSLFRPDLDDGSLEQLAMTPQPLAVLVAAKLLGHWSLTALPLVVLSPVLAAGLSLPWQAVPTLVLALLLGTPILIVISAIGSALTVSLNRGGLLLSIVVLPLVVPVIIFGTTATDLAALGENPAGVLYLLASILVLALVLGPLAIAAALRISLD